METIERLEMLKELAKKIPAKMWHPLELHTWRTEALEGLRDHYRREQEEKYTNPHCGIDVECCMTRAE